jgi:GTPase SAR1 family protein
VAKVLSRSWKLSSLPPQIQPSSKFFSLFLISSLSFFCSGLEFKKHIELFSLPNEFSRASNKEILAYLRELHSSPPTKRFRMRLMIVGPGEAGKTTLVQRLLDNTFSPNQFSMTDGVSMKEWNPTSEMNLTLWDFGGQQVYLNTHTMFFADKSLYLLVWNPRTRTDLRVLEEYILNIRSRTKVGHIIFVTTHGAEVQDRESKQWLKALSKYNYLSYHNVDSYSGLGIAELKQTIINFVTEDQAAQELIPAWYLELEAHLKELSKSEFSIDRERFLSICFLFWKPFNQAQSLTILDPRFLEVANAVLSLFHQWGVIFLLKKLSTQSSIENDFSQCGDIVLDPQRLAHVFKCVISASSAVSGRGSSSASAASPSELLSQGFLSHDQIGSIWEGYDPRLHSQFLRLLQDSELCYEQYDLSGASTNCSLVPSLLPVDIELEFSAAQNTSPIVNQGFVRISFDCLLPNFFPRLMVRLRDVSSPSAISRHHFIVSLHEGDLDQGMVKSSFVRVVEDHDSKSLLLYPEGVSFGATRLCCEAIRELMNESFSGMCTKEISFTTEDTSYLKKKLLSCFQSNSSPTLTLENGMVIPLTFLSPLLKESHDSKETFSQFPSESLFIRSVLQNRLNQFQESKDAMDRFTLGRALMKAIPICREHGLGLERSPIVLWLVGRCDLPPSTPTSSSSEYLLYAVSPNVNPSLPWMFILDSVIHLSVPHCDEEANSHWDLDFQCLVIECLNHLIPSITWPSNVTHWSLFLPHAMEKEELFKLILEKEKNLFDSHIDFFGIEFLLWKPLLMEQRNPVALMKRVEEMMEVLRSNQEELKSSQQAIVSQLNRVEASVTHLSDQLTNVFLDIQEEFRRWNEEGLREIREVWGTRVDNLERLLLRSSKDDLEVLIKRELKGLELQLDEKLTDMESMNAERLMIEFRSLSNELMSASLGRQQGDETSAQKLDQMLLQMRVIQNQMDRVEEKMTQFVANFADCLSVVKGELLANGHSNGLKELREFWMEKMSDLENLIHQKNAHPNSSNGSLSEETIEKLVRKIDKKLKVRFHHFDLSVSEMTPQLMDMKAQLLGLVTGINAGDLKSEKRFESVMGELKELQTQLVESIHLQEELSQNLNQVFAFLSSSGVLC